VYLMTGADWRAWAGVAVFNGGVGPTSLYAYAATGEGLFTDVLDALCGRHAPAGADVAALATAGWTGGGAPAFTAGIDTDDRVWLEAALGFSVAGVDYGFTANTAAVPVGARFRATAPSEWTRGNIEGLSALLVITPAGGGAAYSVPHAARVQSVPVALRASTLADADAVPDAETLQAADNAVSGGATLGIRWGVDAAGHVWRSWDTAAAPGALAPVWTSASSRQRLGFSGAEVAVVVGTRATVTADYPCPGVLAPSRPLAEPLVPWVDVQAATTRTLAGRVYRVERAQTVGWTVQVWLDGLLDDGDDLWDHYRRRWVPYQAEHVTVYLEAGDTRRRGEVPAGDVYGLLRTVQDGGLHGRLVCTLAESHAAQTELRGEGGLYRRAPLVLQVVEVPGA
jgi:hypothetical protein